MRFGQGSAEVLTNSMRALVAGSLCVLMAEQPMVAAAMTRCLPPKYTNAVVNTIGIIEPPRKPCSALKTIML